MDLYSNTKLRKKSEKNPFKHFKNTKHKEFAGYLPAKHKLARTSALEW